MHRYNRNFRALLLLTLALVLCSQTRAEEVAGMVNASSLPDNAEIVLTGNTNLYMDTNKTFSRIRGNYDLSVSGGNVLTVNDKKGDAIFVGSFSSSSSMVISCGTNGACIYAKGNVSLSGKDVKLTGAKFGIYSTGSISITCPSLAITGAWGLYALQDVDIPEGITSIDAYVTGIMANTITLSTDVTSKGTGYGINARSHVVINGGTVVTKCEVDGSAIESNGYIAVNGGSVTAMGAKYGMHSDKGAILIDGNVTAHGAWAIQANSDVTINSGTVKVDAFGTGIVSEDGVISISANVVAINGIMASKNVIINSGIIDVECDRSNCIAIISQKGDVIIKGGYVKAFGIKYGLYSANGTVNIAAPVSAKATGWAVSAKEITLSPKYSIIYPTEAQIVGSTICESNGNRATNVTIGQTPISGQVTLASGAHIGEKLEFTVSGAVAATDVSYQWQISELGMVWSNISGETGSYYTPTKDDLGKFIRVVVSAENMKGYLYSDGRKVEKCISKEDVVPMTLGIADNQVYVNYAVPSQEYIILSYNKVIANLTASDWANAVSPSSSGKLVMGGSKGSVNYVYTRKKETDVYSAGSNIAYEKIYLGDPTTYLQGIKMKVSLMGMDGISPYFTPLNKEDNGAYYVKCGDVIRIKVSQLPETATFYGIHSSRWINNQKGGKFYANYQCTLELDANTSYKEVYYKAEKQMNNNEIIAEYTSGGPNSVYTDRFYLNVASEDGYVLMDHFDQPSVTIAEGEKWTGIAIRTYPLKATLTSTIALIIDKDVLPGTPPTVNFNDADHTISVDATNATEGTYFFEVYQNGVKMPNKVQVDVTSIKVEGVDMLMQEIQAERGTTIQMEMLLIPANAKAMSVEWGVDNPKVATVTDKGVLTVKDDAPLDVKAVVSVTVNGKHTAQCDLVVPELKVTELGDSNNDGKVDADDITAIANYIMKQKTAVFNFYNADLNGDKKVDAADLVLLISKVK